jgi:PAS domain-containing protein
MMSDEQHRLVGAVRSGLPHAGIEAELDLFYRSALASFASLKLGKRNSLKDIESRYLFVNRQFEKTVHARHEEIRGKRDEEIFPTEQAAAFRANDLQVLHAGVAIEFEEATIQDDRPHTSIVLKVPLSSTNGNQWLASIGLT